MINGAGGADISELVIDFIAKHHSCFNSIFWINASHPLSITTTVDDIIKVRFVTQTSIRYIHSATSVNLIVIIDILVLV